MAGHELISAQLAILAARLPAQAVEELADGLHEAYEAQLDGHDPDAAARAAIAEFGDAETITAAFFRDSPWRRMAVLLLATGPFMGLVWGLSLVSARAWNWPIPVGVRLTYGALLLAVAGTLLAVALERRAYRRARAATLAGAMGLMALDVAMLVAVVSVPSVALWPLLLAVPASLIRVLATLRALPPVLSR
ncbi:permease prefix domain 1-containing protein [Nonomuraea sp. NPDC050556]|uniref:permease prefix domain 1-containing protein n=1 Tax=Nonomuraea sp. NPDC050556 TaxID=3364369 RepID=UPI0037A8CEB9